MAQERLQKVMANAGVASRRACEEIIQAGRVTVNGQVVTELGVKVDPLLDQVRVDGDLLKPRPASRRTYLMLYKPAGVLSVFDDPRDRPGLENYVKEPVRLYPIGRLDMDSEGLLVLTDDGDLTLKLSHPRYEHPKTYLVLVDRVPGTDTLARFRRGILLDDGVTAPSTWRVLEHPAMVPPSSDPDAQTGVWLHVTLYEGRKRQVRRMAAAENMQVRRLVRVSIGSLRLDRKLQPGQSRPLTRRELDELQREADEQPDSVVPRRKPAGERSPEPAARRSSAGRAAASAPRPAVRSGNAAPV
ncbi:MAG: pseudouridine synthase, partial [Anaerolineae bacterium]